MQHKVVFAGEKEAGKTSIVRRISGAPMPKEYEPTNAAACCSLNFTSKIGTTIKCDVWDTSGDEKYRLILPLYLRGANGFVIVYNAESNKDFASYLNEWNTMISNFIERDTAVLIVVTKADVNTWTTPKEEIIKIASNESIHVVFSSALKDESCSNVSSAIGDTLYVHRELRN